MRRLLLAALLAAAATLAFPLAASATLNLQYVFNGQGGYSSDGLGQLTAGGLIQADVPAGSTVEQAYLYGTYSFTIDPTLGDRTIDFDGTPVVTTTISSVNQLSTTRADVTAQVAAKVGAGGGITNFAVNNDPFTLDGVALVVVYSNPALPTTTVAILDGSASQTGDTATFTFASPLDKTIPGFSATMALGIGFGFQGGAGAGTHECGTATDQSSLVDVNGARLTSCAGNYDDGFASNGALITVGGVGDTTANPADPFQRPFDGALPRVEDDELYDIAGFTSQGDASLTITSSNPSQDDNLFLAVIQVAARATVTTEVCDDGRDNDGDGLVDADDPDCAPPPPAPVGWMTGGGWATSDAGARVTYGLTVQCDATAAEPSSLQVNWERSRFHLTSLTSAACADDPAVENAPGVAFDTLTGAGEGRWNGVEGATATWRLVDAGEPGGSDTIQLEVWLGGTLLLSVDGPVGGGNLQAHGTSG